MDAIKYFHQHLAPDANGTWGDWKDWESCTKSCGTGTQNRTRLCNNPAQAGNGTPCPSDAGNDGTETLNCNTADCPGKAICIMKEKKHFF